MQQQPPLPAQPPLPNETPPGPSNSAQTKNSRPKKRRNNKNRGRARAKRKRLQKQQELAAVATAMGFAGGKPKKEKWKKYSALTAAEKQQREENQIKRAKYKEFRERVGADKNNSPGIPRAPHNTTQFLMEETGEEVMPPLFEGMPLQEMGSMEGGGIDYGSSSEEFSNESDQDHTSPRARQKPASEGQSKTASVPEPGPAAPVTTRAQSTTTPPSQRPAAPEVHHTPPTKTTRHTPSPSPAPPVHSSVLPATSSRERLPASTTPAPSLVANTPQRHPLRAHQRTVIEDATSTTTTTDEAYRTNLHSMHIVQSPVRERPPSPVSQSLATTPSPRPTPSQRTEVQRVASGSVEHQLRAALERAKHFESLCGRLRKENLALRRTVGMMSSLISAPMVLDP